ncbi:MAG: hypothetical protein KW788_04540 [Candidatus Doudnabacteria bacterium]|nr:hypothetical protein [Candidatus Doudnabacteria bacterium]
MRKIAIAAGLLLLAAPALAAVTVTTAPVSLVTTAQTLGASSTPLALFSFTLGADAAETLSSVAITVNNNGTSTATGADLASVSVYRDSNANGTLETATDLVAGTQTTVNVGSATTVTTGANKALPGTFIVALSTGASWSATAPADSITATLPANGITTSANSPTVTAVTTNTITATAPADVTGPVLTSAVLQTSGTGKSVVLTFGEATNKPAITAGNIATILTLSGSHSWLDGTSAIGSATWSTDGKVLTVVLSNATSNPTVAAGDTVTVAGSVIKDVAGNNATGSVTITAATSGGNDDGDEDEHEGMPCANALINGRLYKLAGDTNPTVYLAAACRLKPFRGAAVFHARGNKFQNIIILQSLTGLDVSTKPALPADGTLIKGSDKTVWFVETGKRRKGFTSEQVFKGLGFKFSQVNQISDDDLNTMSVDTAPIATATSHPDGSLIKCTNSSTVFQVKSGQEFPFTNLDAFVLRGHSFDHIAVVDCGRFHYVLGTNIEK